MDIALARSLARQVSPVALDVYDKEEQASLLPFLATTHQNPGNTDIYTLEWGMAFPELREWVGDRGVQEVFSDSIAITPENYEITFSYDKDKLESDDAILSIADASAKMAGAFSRGKVMLGYKKVFEANPLSYDGQNFFDTGHVHPDASTFSNLLTITRTTTGKPTVAEARDELRNAMSSLMANTLIRNSLVRSSAVVSSLVVITKSYDTWKSYEDLLLDEEVGSEPNRFRGAFQLLRDFSPLSGDEKKVDVVFADPSGPRPVVFVVNREMKGVEFDTTQTFKNRKVDFGMDAKYGVGAGFPQTAVRLTE